MDPLIVNSNKLVVNIFYSNETLFKQVNSIEEMSMVAQLFVLTRIGGLVLPTNSIVLGNIQPLLYYEAVLYLPEREEGEPVIWENMVLGGHRGARVLHHAINMYLKKGMGGVHPINEVARTMPEIWTRLGQRETGLDTSYEESRGGKLRVGGKELLPLLVGRDIWSMRELSTYCMVIGVREEMDKNTVEMLGGKDNLEMIMRRLWLAMCSLMVEGFSWGHGIIILVDRKSEIELECNVKGGKETDIIIREIEKLKDFVEHVVLMKTINL